MNLKVQKIPNSQTRPLAPHRSLNTKMMRTHSHARGMERIAPLFLLSPFMVVFSLVLVLPLFYGLYTSLFTVKLVGGSSFVGVENYIRAFESSTLWDSVGRVLIYGVIQVPIMLGAALVFAIVLDLGLVKARRIFRLVYFLPFSVPAVVATLMWGFIFEPRYGPFAQIASWLAVPAVNFLGPTGVLPTIGVIQLWEFTGFNMVILFTALRSIPAEYTEAAVLDGASLWDLAVRVRVPLLRRALVLTSFLAALGTLQLFTEPFILTTYTGSISPTFTPNMFIYNSAFAAQQYNYAAAVSFIIGLLMVLGILTARLLTRRSRAGSV